jgi:hypothetical protein
LAKPNFVQLDGYGNTVYVTAVVAVLVVEVQSTDHEKIPARNWIYAHAQDFAITDVLQLATLKAFLPQPLNKQQTAGFHVFTYIRHL